MAFQGDLGQCLKGVTRDAAPAKGALTLPGITPQLLQQQFMFAVAVHADAHQLTALLLEMRRAKQSLLHAARSGELTTAFSCTNLLAQASASWVVQLGEHGCWV